MGVDEPGVGGVYGSLRAAVGHGGVERLENPMTRRIANKECGIVKWMIGAGAVGTSLLSGALFAIHYSPGPCSLFAIQSDRS